MRPSLKAFRKATPETQFGVFFPARHRQAATGLAADGPEDGVEVLLQLLDGDVGATDLVFSLTSI
jgi:hypothetical protein